MRAFVARTGRCTLILCTQFYVAELWPCGLARGAGVLASKVIAGVHAWPGGQSPSAGAAAEPSGGWLAFVASDFNMPALSVLKKGCAACFVHCRLRPFFL